jgi:hypothetical protein
VYTSVETESYIADGELIIIIIIIIIILIIIIIIIIRDRKENKMQEVMYRDVMNVEYEMCDNTGSNWSHRNCNKRFLNKNMAAVPGNHSIDSLRNTQLYQEHHISH